MALDHGGGIAIDGRAFNDVRVGRALRQEARSTHIAGGIGKHVHKDPANDLALLLGLFNARQLTEKALSSIDRPQIHLEILAKELLDAGGLIFYAGGHCPRRCRVRLFADGAMEERRRDGRIDAAGEAQDHLVITHARANVLDAPGDEGRHGPGAAAAADFQTEIAMISGCRIRCGRLPGGTECRRCPCRQAARRHIRCCGCGRALGCRRQRETFVAWRHPQRAGPP